MTFWRRKALSIDDVYSKYATRRNPLPSEADVAALEGKLATKFPHDYRDFLLKYNGGRFSDPKFKTTGRPRTEDRLTFLNGIRATHPSEELASAGDLALFDDNDPTEILPIGYTIMGNLIFIILHPEDFGAIGLKPASKTQSIFLGHSVQEFLQTIR